MSRNVVRDVVAALLAGSVAAVSSVILVVGGFLVLRIGSEYLARTEFDASQWKIAATASRGESPRLRMIDDLLDRYDLEEMTRAEVIALLGEPDSAKMGGEYLFPGWHMVYYLGRERGIIGIDSEWLAIKLDESQNVRESRILIP